MPSSLSAKFKRSGRRGKGKRGGPGIGSGSSKALSRYQGQQGVSAQSGMPAMSIGRKKSARGRTALTAVGVSYGSGMRAGRSKKGASMAIKYRPAGGGRRQKIRTKP